MPAKYTPEDRTRRFSEQVDKSRGPAHCWPWTGARNQARDGYGVLNWGGQVVYAHRIAWEAANGRKVPDGLFVCHTCDNPPCVNPDHLWVGTTTDNMRDMAAKGRTGHSPIKARGEAAGAAKLTERQVREIFALKGAETQVATSARYGISASTVSDIYCGRSWAHISA